MTDRNKGTSYELAADNSMIRGYTDGLVQERRNSIALAMELPISCTNPCIPWYHSPQSYTKLK